MGCARGTFECAGCLTSRLTNLRTAHYPSFGKKTEGRKPSKMFMVAPDMDNESLLAHVCESLASASVMTSDIAAYVDAPQRHTLLAIQQVIMLAELAVNRVLDNVDVPKPAPHS
ncbi:hypothetical protein PMI36_00291 [Pseudomonas sp. GM79]|nr:hypothetical protein PMI36_00291 [Pseudomonas sp. GM79]